jgi:hypothetical protein
VVWWVNLIELTEDIKRVVLLLEVVEQ